MTKSDQLAGRLTADIASGRYPVGERLPSQAELRTAYGNVSRTTVMTALRRLTDQGLIRGGQGSPAVVVAKPGEAVGPATAAGIGDLRSALREAFEADEITMDVLSLTSETMATYLGDPVVLITQREIKPKSIRLRLMLPDITGIKLAFPRAVLPDGQESQVSDWSRPRHRDMVIRYAKTLEHSLLTLRDRGLVADVSVQIRTVPFTPPLKLYLLNGDQLLEGYYTLTTWQPEPPKGEPELTILDSDSFSADATLFRYTTPQHSVKVETAQRFFDSYWDNLAQEADFSQT
ncbi:GntR family transcriptional regulator [Streptomyces montanisoli]|uniref:Winged helix-turn-helix transcriptional regulator n=1 Tax=Streptomyces montanisoli TaxID=2798581 RepID=A0A940RZU0_9ACTN|nr:winged helix-turn-helix domain-containing protein [Streptomyces montanisoli]MBP0460149.1 winged helix-turn-helix transcriptional regulator [Streptomyces montanisoli]